MLSNKYTRASWIQQPTENDVMTDKYLLIFTCKVANGFEFHVP